MIDLSMTIGGKGVSGAADSVPVINPATEEVIGQAPGCSRDQLDDAIAAARAAFPAWSATPFDERKALVGALAGIITANIDELARLLTLEQGKPLAVAKGEVEGAAYWPMTVATYDLPQDERGDDSRRVTIRHMPIGVVGAIVPWNYPVLTAMMKIAPAVAAGNCVVLKPAPTPPLATLRLGELIRDALPAGVVNIVSGGDDLGPWMTSHPGIDKISFTGSTATGRRIMQSAADRIARFTLELGGNDPAIVFPDVNVDAVADKLFWGSMLNSGQICVAAKRLYVHADIYDRFLAAFLKIARSLKMGDGMGEGVALGPIQNRAQYERVKRLAENARAAGYTLHQAEAPTDGKGFFFPVTVVEDPADDAEIVRDEQFGPILPILRFTDVEDVIARANGTPYGLGGSVWSADVAQASAVADRLDCAASWVNTIMDAPPDQPMGGHKQSGFGVENGLLGLLEYMSVQSRVTLPAVAPAPQPVAEPV
jgi:acyl-CoA reductase-like NAD-dependent aldehyde dehydrogenase